MLRSALASAIADQSGLKEFVGRVFDLPKRAFEFIGIPDYLIPEFSGPLLIFIILALLFRPVRYALRGLARRVLRGPARRLARRYERHLGVEVIPDEVLKQQELREKNYLRWLKTELHNISQQWHETPIIPTPAHRKRPLGRLLKYRARLFRHDLNDYAHNPALNDAELSIRAGFGRRARIRNLAAELRRFRKIVVLGDPGSGKSVCLRQLAFDLCERELARGGGRSKVLPVYLDMGAYDGWEDEAARRPTDVLRFAKESLQTRPSGARLPENHPASFMAESLEGLLHEGRVCLIFDALDEMPQESYQERYQALKDFMGTWEAFGDNRFVYSCRILDYDPSFSVDEVIIDRFDRRRIANFLKRHVPAIARDLYRRIVDDEALEELVSNPFFLQALAYINMTYPSDARAPRALWIPASRGELLKEFVEQLLDREAGLKQRKYLEPVEGGLDTLRRFLSELAFALQQRKEGRTSAQVGSLQEIWQRYPQWESLVWISRRARILGKRGEPAHDLVDTAPPGVTPPERLEFIHHRLQEFFSAEELARRLAAGEAVSRYLEDIWWQETVVFAIGLIEEPQSIIGLMLATRPETDRWLGRVLLLAEESYPEEEGDEAEEDEGGEEEAAVAAEVAEGRQQNVESD